ncbi:MAG: 50S ribosomal L9 C-terminal domain-containing protein, partial [Candidatus Paceibacterota bacterium]
KIAGELKSAVLDFSLKVGESGQAFGSVNAAEIIKALNGLDIFKKYSEEIKNFEVTLEKPIKELGERLVEINLGKGIKSKIKVIVRSQP